MTTTASHVNTPDSSRKTAAERDARVEEGLSLVYATAAKIYKTVGGLVEFDELVSFGTIGLMQAAARYDKNSQAQFTTYAYYRIHGAMMDGLRALGPMSRSAWRQHKQQTALDEAAPQTMALTATPVLRHPTTPATAEADIASKQAAELLDAAVKQLPERESFLIASCYYGERNMVDAGKDLGISKSWTSRLHDRALKRLRRELRGHSYETLAA